MGINRPLNLNITQVPGNGSIVGPSTTPSCIQTTTVCETCHNCSGVCVCQVLPGQTSTFCASPCCDVVCGCDCIENISTVPSGVWKSSEQYEAKERNAWPPDTSSTGSVTCLCNINVGYLNCGNVSSVAGNIICTASSVAWVAAPETSEVQRCWQCRDDAVTVANAAAGCGDWFVPDCGQTQNPGFACRTHYDSYNCSSYWSDTQGYPTTGWRVDFNNGHTMADAYKSSNYRVRAFRCVSY